MITHISETNKVHLFTKKERREIILKLKKNQKLLDTLEKKSNKECDKELIKKDSFLTDRLK